MKTQEILSIVALALLGLCFLCGLAKMAMKKDSDKKNCDKACSMAIFAAVVLVGVSQLLTETEKYTAGKIKKVYCNPDGQICDSEKPLADCLKVPGCYASYNTCMDHTYEYCQECKNCYGQTICGGECPQ